MARTCKVPLHRAASSTIETCMTSLQLSLAFKDDVLIPWRKSEPEDFRTARELVIADRGGFSYEPKPSVHDDVGEVDFTSLYPMLMMKKNLSPETISCTCCPDSAEKVPELGYHVCRREGFIPRTLKLPLEKRVKYKGLRDREGGSLRKYMIDVNPPSNGS